MEASCYNTGCIPFLLGLMNTSVANIIYSLLIRWCQIYLKNFFSWYGSICTWILSSTPYVRFAMNYFFCIFGAITSEEYVFHGTVRNAEKSFAGFRVWCSLYLSYVFIDFTFINQNLPGSIMISPMLLSQFPSWHLISIFVTVNESGSVSPVFKIQALFISRTPPSIQ